jgi:hypothetical protein
MVAPLCAAFRPISDRHTHTNPEPHRTRHTRPLSRAREQGDHGAFTRPQCAILALLAPVGESTKGGILQQRRGFFPDAVAGQIKPDTARQGLMAMTPSISTEIWFGNEPMPTAERPCRPFSPNTSTNRFDMPSATFG